MGLFDLFKKKSGPEASPCPEDRPALPADRDAGPEDKASGEKASGENSADHGSETPGREETVPGPVFVPGDAVAPSDEEIPGVDGETVRRIRQLCADRVPFLRDLGKHSLLLDSLREVYPSVGMFLPEERLREGMPKEDADKVFGDTLRGVAKGLGAVRYRQAARHFNDVETDDLKNAWVLLDYFAAAAAASDPAPFQRGRRMLDRTLWGRLEREDIPHLRQMRAAGKTPDGIAYIMQTVEEDWNYFIELHDTEGKLPQVGKPPEGSVAVLSFGLTKDEFALKDGVSENGVRPKVDEFISLLLQKLPQDRILAAGFADRASKKLTPALIRPGCVTMDDGKLPRWRSRLGLERYASLEKFFTLHSKATGPRFPLLDQNFSALVYTSAEYAEGAVKANPAFDLTVREMTAPEFREFVSSFAPIGVERFLVNRGSADHPVEILRDDWPGVSPSSPAYEGAALNRLTLRFRQNLQARNDPAARAAASTCWNMAAHVLPGTLFLVPFNYREDLSAEDFTLHVTALSSKLLWIKTLERSLGRRLKTDEVSALTRSAPADTNIYDRGMFFGGEDYTPSRPAGSEPVRPMLFSTVKSSNATWLCGFTDIRSLKAVFPANRRIAVLTWGEIKRFAGVKNSDGSVSAGIVVNPGFAELALSAAQIEEIDRAAKEPVKIFVPQQKKDAGT